jgi:hypothetical protein
MNIKRWRVYLTVLGIVSALVLAYWILDHARWTITGQVVDADTGKPIEGAAVAIDWWEPLFGPPGLSATRDLEIAESVSDAQGYFRVPKYSLFGLGKQYRMAVYKQGYVLWSSEKIFPSYEKRRNFSLENGMMIPLEQFRKDYSKDGHAIFVGHMQPMSWTPRFHKAIKSETDLADQIIQKSRRK